MSHKAHASLAGHLVLLAVALGFYFAIVLHGHHVVDREVFTRKMLIEPGVAFLLLVAWEVVIMHGVRRAPARGLSFGSRTFWGILFATFGMFIYLWLNLEDEVEFGNAYLVLLTLTGVIGYLAGGIVRWFLPVRGSRIP
ncbi:MAG: hypothetical protein PVI37_09380 [Gammaproteobacteria bacterium]|jgi:hypothetical protein